MRIAYFDCFNGASGDMILGALIDAGLSVDRLRDQLARLDLSGYGILAERVRKQGFQATQFHVNVDPTADKPHRHLSHILAIIDGASISDAVKSVSKRVFHRLAEAEAQAHGTTIEKVHFHEVGAIDAIVDVVGASIGLAELEIEKVVCSPIPVGSGVIRCDHGEMPVPAPATALLLQGVPIAETSEPGELTTPTGAAILTTATAHFGPLPAMTLERVGCGAGRREGKHRPNILRVLLGQATGPNDAIAAEDEQDEVTVLEANIDDATAEMIAHACDRLMLAGALDAYCTPVVMKKNRPAVQVTVLCHSAAAPELEALLFAETTTFGVRSHRVLRRKLSREHVTVQTQFGPVRMKVGRRSGRLLTASPEFDDCRSAATHHDVPLRVVIDAARLAWHETRPDKTQVP